MGTNTPHICDRSPSPHIRYHRDFRAVAAAEGTRRAKKEGRHSVSDSDDVESDITYDDEFNVTLFGFGKPLNCKEEAFTNFANLKDPSFRCTLRIGVLCLPQGFHSSNALLPPYECEPTYVSSVPCMLLRN